LTILTLTIKGQPTAKGRPKFSTRSGYAIAYTPAKTRNAEADIRSQAIQQLPPGFKPLTGAIAISISFSLQRPKSLKKSIIHCTKRPDAENLSKTVLDALNTICFVDDSQIIRLMVDKHYGEPGTLIRLEEISKQVTI